MVNKKSKCFSLQHWHTPHTLDMFHNTQLLQLAQGAPSRIWTTNLCPPTSPVTWHKLPLTQWTTPTTQTSLHISQNWLNTQTQSVPSATSPSFIDTQQEYPHSPNMQHHPEIDYLHFIFYFRICCHNCTVEISWPENL